MSDSLLLESVRDLVGRPGEMREESRTLTLTEKLGEGLAVVPAGATLTADIRLESVHEGILATVSVDGEYQAECGRCLDEFATPLEVDFQELFVYNPSEADEYGVSQDQIDLDPPLRDAVVLALPFQPVCRPDCPGLDPESGEKRDTAAGAAESTGIDPRWAALAQYQADQAG